MIGVQGLLIVHFWIWRSMLCFSSWIRMQHLDKRNKWWFQDYPIADLSDFERLQNDLLHVFLFTFFGAATKHSIPVIKGLRITICINIVQGSSHSSSYRGWLFSIIQSVIQKEAPMNSASLTSTFSIVLYCQILHCERHLLHHPE